MPGKIIFIQKENLYFLYRVLGESISSEGTPKIPCALALDFTESSLFLWTEIFIYFFIKLLSQSFIPLIGSDLLTFSLSKRSRILVWRSIMKTTCLCSSVIWVWRLLTECWSWLIFGAVLLDLLKMLFLVFIILFLKPSAGSSITEIFYHQSLRHNNFKKEDILCSL